MLYMANVLLVFIPVFIVLHIRKSKRESVIQENRGQIKELLACYGSVVCIYCMFPDPMEKYFFPSHFMIFSTANIGGMVYSQDGVEVWDLDLEDPGLNPCSISKCPWSSWANHCLPA